MKANKGGSNRIIMERESIIYLHDKIFTLTEQLSGTHFKTG